MTSISHDDRESVDSLLERNAIEFVPSDIPTKTHSIAFDALREVFRLALEREDSQNGFIDRETRVPKKGSMGRMVVYVTPQPKLETDVLGDVDYGSDIVKWRFRGYFPRARFPEWGWDVNTDYLYSELTGRSSPRRGFHTVQTFTRDVKITVGNLHGMTTEEMLGRLSQYLENEKCRMVVGNVISANVYVDYSSDNWWYPEPEDALFWQWSFNLIFENGERGIKHVQLSTGKTEPQPPAEKDTEKSDVDT